jgi:hypothetical protein
LPSTFLTEPRRPFPTPPSYLSWQNSAKPVQDEVPLA